VSDNPNRIWLPASSPRCNLLWLSEFYTRTRRATHAATSSPPSKFEPNQSLEHDPILNRLQVEPPVRRNYKGTPIVAGSARHTTRFPKTNSIWQLNTDGIPQFKQRRRSPRHRIWYESVTTRKPTMIHRGVNRSQKEPEIGTRSGDEPWHPKFTIQ
jgi:hypothetical protein